MPSERLIQALNRWKDQFEAKAPVHLAIIVSEADDENYATVDMLRPDLSRGERRDVIRGKMRIWPGAVVRVTEDRKKHGPGELAIVGADAITYGGENIPTLLELHGDDHGYEQPDEISNLSYWQVAPMRVQPYSGLEVAVQPGVYESNGYHTLDALEYVDLTANQPGAGWRWVFLTIDAEGNINTTNGTIVAVTPGYDDIPTPPIGEYKLAVVRVSSFMTEIARGDILDVRHLNAADAIGIYTVIDHVTKLEDEWSEEECWLITNYLRAVGWTRTVGVAGDHTTIQDAIDWFKNRVVGDCTIEVEAGTYAENVTIEDVFLAASAGLTIQGDTRVLAALTYVDGALSNPNGLANGGTFDAANVTTTATNVALDEITISGGTVDPDFDADGWAAGDKILVYDQSAGTVVERTIDSISPGGAGNNVIKVTVALAAALGGDGDSVTLLPDRRIEPSAAGPCVLIDGVMGVKIKGFYLESHTGANCNGIKVENGGFVECENIAAQTEDEAFVADYTSTLIASDGACSSVGSLTGFYATRNSTMECKYGVAVDGTNGFRSWNHAAMTAQNTISIGNTRGYWAGRLCTLVCDNATARQNTTGYIAQDTAYIHAVSTNANNNGNTTDYNPTPGAIPGYAQGTDYAVIRAS